MIIKRTDIDFDKLIKCVEDNEFSLYLYKPTLTKPLLFDFESMSLTRRVRYLLEYLRSEHYKVFYLSVRDEFVGFCVVTPGGRRLCYSSRDDIVLGPYYIDESKRGNGYSKELIRLVIENYGRPYHYAYDWIHKDNLPSIKASEACGFVRYGEIKIVGKLRRLVPVNGGGTSWVYQYKGLGRTHESTNNSTSSR